MGNFVTAGSGGITTPEGLKFGPDGNLYVTDYANSGTGNAAYRYNGSTGAFINKFIASGSGGLKNPEDLAFGPDGNLYVASDANHNVLRFQGPSGASPGAFMDVFVVADQTKVKNAQGVAFGPDGHLYVSSWGNNNVVRYNGTTGAFIDVYYSGNDYGHPLGWPCMALTPTSVARRREKIEEVVSFYLCFGREMERAATRLQPRLGICPTTGGGEIRPFFCM